MERTNEAYHQLDQKHYLPTFKRYPLALERGEGSHVWDVEGNRYLDLLAGIAVNCVGHAHPKLVGAISAQAEKLIHISNFYVSPPQMELAERLTSLAGLEHVFFSNSGAESAEGAIKIARKYAFSKGRGGTVISFEGSFHGRTLATIATGKEAMQRGFGPMPGGFKRVPFNDLEAVHNAMSKDVAAIIIEPIQGEGGVNPADPEFLQGLRSLCDEHDIALIFDEIQCGVGRTGKMFAFEHYGVKPDIMTLAKGLGGGVPIGAILSNAKVSAAIDYGDHGTTFGGNPLVCAAALAVLNIIEEEELLKAATDKGNWLKQQFAELDHASITDIRGMGLMLGVEFDHETKPLVAALLKNGVLANATAGNVLRLVPPLNVPMAALEAFMETFEKTLNDLH